MHTASITPTFVEHTLTPARGPRSAWIGLQEALGGGIATAVLQTPERRMSYPNHSEFRAHPDAPPANEFATQSFFSNLLAEWHFAFETLMNGRWDLTENPYAKIWMLPGMLLVHEDPLGWVVDAHAEDIAAGTDLDAPTWTLLMPKPTSNHGMIAAAEIETLPHADILNAALTDAAEREGHNEIGPLSWKLHTPKSGAFDILEA